ARPGGDTVAALAQGLLAGEANLALAVDGDDLDQHLVALLQHVGDVLDPLVGELGDVHQAVGTREDLHEGAELHDAPYRAEVGLPDLRLLGEVADHRDGLLDFGLVRRGDVDGPVVLDVDRATGAVDDVAHRLAAGADDVLDALGPDLDGRDPRRPLRDLRPRLVEHLGHLPEDVEAALPRLLEGALQDLPRHAGDLDVHLDRGDPVGGTADLEVHVAEVILVTQDVREDGDLVALLDEHHGDAGDGRLDGHARVHEGEGGAADGGHRRGAVGLGDVRGDARHIREGGLVRHHVAQGALGQGAVPDLAATGRAQELHLTHRVGREVVVEHEALEVHAGEHLHALLVLARAEGGGADRLRLAAGEDGGAVHARQRPHLAPDRTDLVVLATRDAHAVFEDHLPHVRVLEVLEVVLELAFAVHVVVAEFFLHLRERGLARRGQRSVALGLLGDGVGLGDRPLDNEPE